MLYNTIIIAFNKYYLQYQNQRNLNYYCCYLTLYEQSSQSRSPLDNLRCDDNQDDDRHPHETEKKIKKHEEAFVILLSKPKVSTRIY